MRLFDKKVIILYALLSIYLMIISFFSDNIQVVYNLYVNPIFWLITAIASFFCFGFNEIRYKAIQDKCQIVLIVMLAYILLYFLSGLFFNFAHSIYSTKVISIIKNIWMYVSIIIFKEFVREKLVYYSGQRYVFLFFITSLFILLDIEFFNISYYFQSGETIFKYFFSTIFPIITGNIVCTYLVLIGGIRLSLIYKVLIVLIKLLVPIQPNLDWFLLGIFESLLPVLIYIFVSKYHLIRTSRESKRKIRGADSLFKSIMIGMIIIFALFFAGIFKYKPIAVMSGSMQPIFYRGDILIVEKIAEENCDELELYDIIEYRLDNKIILHRIVKIEENESGKLVFTTKGDNNEKEDAKKVESSQVIGKILFSIKYIGYPSVLLNEYFSK